MLNLEEVFAENYCIERFELKPGIASFTAITNRNKYLNKEKRFKAMKVAELDE